MDYFLISLIAFYIGWKINEIWMARSFAEILKDLGVSPDRVHRLALDNGVEVATDKEAIELKIDSVEGQFLAYEVKDNRFITQATTGEQLLAQIIEHYPAGTKINVDKAQGGDIIQAAAASMKNSD